MKPFAHSNVLAPSLRSLEVFPSARHEPDPDHDGQKEKRDIIERDQLRKDHALIIRAPSTAESTSRFESAQD